MPVTTFVSRRLMDTRSAHDRPFVRIMLTEMSMTVTWQCLMPIPKNTLRQDPPTTFEMPTTFEPIPPRTSLSLCLGCLGALPPPRAQPPLMGRGQPGNGLFNVHTA